jgi:hypothetical protein
MLSSLSFVALLSHHVSIALKLRFIFMKMPVFVVCRTYKSVISKEI